MSLNETSFSGQINLYKCGDIDSFVAAQELIFEEAAAAGSVEMVSTFQSALFDVRNKQMAEMIDNILKASDNRVLFAFGLSHWVVGENNLGNLLKDYGYSLEYVPNYAKDDAEDLSNEECGVVFNNVTGEFDLIGMSNSTGPAPSASPVSSPSVEGTASPSSGVVIKSTASILSVLCAFGSWYLLN